MYDQGKCSGIFQHVFMNKQHIDLLTAKKEDLAFETTFKLVPTRNDCK